MDKHLTVLGVFNVVLGALGLFGAAVVFVVLAGGGLMSGEVDAILMTSGIGTVIAAGIALVSLPSLIAGIGLLRRRPWARPLGLVVAVLGLFNMPVGTLLGIYAFWVLLQDETTTLLGVQVHRVA